MDSQQFSKHFQPDTDTQFKNDEFERCLAEWIVGFVQCYPHLIEKKVVKGVEVWIIKFEI